MLLECKSHRHLSPELPTSHPASSLEVNKDLWVPTCIVCIAGGLVNILSQKLTVLPQVRRLELDLGCQVREVASQTQSTGSDPLRLLEDCFYDSSVSCYVLAHASPCLTWLDPTRLLLADSRRHSETVLIYVVVVVSIHPDCTSVPTVERTFVSSQRDSCNS